MQSILDTIKALPEPAAATWQWSDRSSITNCLVELLNKALPAEQEAIYSDLGDLIRPEGGQLYYETEGMSHLRRLLNADGVADIKIDHFKGCLILLEAHGFQLTYRA